MTATGLERILLELGGLRQAVEHLSGMGAEGAQAAGRASRRDAEYYKLEDIIGTINSSCLTIKAWSVGAASIVAIVGQSGLAALRPVMVTIAALAVAFWLTETIWRSNQAAFIRRVRDLEEADREGPQISHQWSRYFLGDEAKVRPISFLGAMFWRETMLPHAVILAFATIAFLWLGTLPDEEQEVVQRITIEGPIELRQGP